MRANQGMNGMAQPATGRWREVLARAQQQLAATVHAAVAAGDLDRGSYQRWLALEHSLCLIGQGALAAIADWHRAEPALRSAALAWATELAWHAKSAAADIRTLDGVTATVPQVDSWRQFADSTCGSTRAGELLGVVLLHSRLMHGPASAAVTRAATLPFATASGSHLVQRSQPPGGRCGDARDALLQAWPASALAAGALRAAIWHHAALATIFAPRHDRRPTLTPPLPVARPQPLPAPLPG